MANPYAGKAISNGLSKGCFRMPAVAACQAVDGQSQGFGNTIQRRRKAQVVNVLEQLHNLASSTRLSAMS